MARDDSGPRLALTTLRGHNAPSDDERFLMIEGDDVADSHTVIGSDELVTTAAIARSPVPVARPHQCRISSPSIEPPVNGSAKSTDRVTTNEPAASAKRPVPPVMVWLSTTVNAVGELVGVAVPSTVVVNVSPLAAVKVAVPMPPRSAG